MNPMYLVKISRTKNPIPMLIMAVFFSICPYPIIAKMKRMKNMFIAIQTAHAENGKSLLFSSLAFQLHLLSFALHNSLLSLYSLHLSSMVLSLY